MEGGKSSQPTAEQGRGPVPCQSRRHRFLLWMLLGGLPLCGWLGWSAAMNSAGMQDYQRLRDERAGIHIELEETRLRHQQLEVDLLVARQSVEDSQVTIADLEQQLFRLQQDVAQYQGALVPNAMAPGVRIQAFELQHTEVPGVFRYKIMVSRVGNESDTVEAMLQLTVEGKQGSQTTRVSLAELSGGRIDALPLNFRYFQVVPGGDDAVLTLPPGFEPEQIHLKVEHDDKVLLEQALEWTETGVRS